MDRSVICKCARACCIALLVWELLCTVKFPAQTKAQFEETIRPAWRSMDYVGDDDAHEGQAQVCAVYASSLLLHRCQAAMSYNMSSGLFETPPLALWRSVEEMMSSSPAAGWGTWQELMMTAKHPWAVYWASAVVPDKWHIMEPEMKENLQLLAEAVPLVMPADPAGAALKAPPPAKQANADNSSSKSSTSSSGKSSNSSILSRISRISSRVAAWFLQDEDIKSSLWVAQCVSDVDHATLKPVDVVQCTVHVRGREKHVGGSFYVERGQAPSPSIRLGKGPLMRFLSRLLGGLQQYRNDGQVLHVLGLLGQLAVPTFGLRQLQQLQQQLGVLELEFDVKVLMIHVMVLLVVLRNWLYHVSVLYKVAVRLSRLGFAGPMDQLTGVALTVLGVVIGLWQTIGFAVLDLCIDALLVKAAMSGLGRSATAAWLLWQVTIPWCGLEARLGSKVYSLARQSWTDIKNLVLNPQVLLNQQAGGVIKQLRPPVAVIGPWPAPLAIPEAVDDLSNADIPRGFICPITQSIMRQPALLLHDATVTPSTYDKEAIQQWLAQHSTDPKSPGTQLRMKSVKLVYNGDLARSIEDWVKDKAQAQADRVYQVRLTPHRWLQLRQQLMQPADAGGDTGVAVPAAAAAAGAAGAAGAGPVAAAGAPVAAAATIIGDAGQMVRQPSVALAHVASLDLPQVAAAGLASFTTATRRMTRAAARRLRHDQPQPDDGGQEQQQRRRRQQPSGSSSSSSDDDNDDDDGMSSDAISEEDDADSGPSAAGGHARQRRAGGSRRPLSARQRQPGEEAGPSSGRWQRGPAAARSLVADRCLADGEVEAAAAPNEQMPRRSPRVRQRSAAVAAATTAATAADV